MDEADLSKDGKSQFWHFETLFFLNFEGKSRHGIFEIRFIIMIREIFLTTMVVAATAWVITPWWSGTSSTTMVDGRLNTTIEGLSIAASSDCTKQIKILSN